MRARQVGGRIALVGAVIVLAVVGFAGTSWAERQDGDHASDAGLKNRNAPAAEDASTPPTTASSTQQDEPAPVTAAATASAAPGEGAGSKFECSTSHHSDTGHGANTGDAYDANCTSGQPSDPSNGQSPNAGQPCAGCVGNADDKNPPGQAPDGSDANNGYECDGNSGVGRSNPAHTRNCTTPPPGGQSFPGTNASISGDAVAAAAQTSSPAAQVLGVSFTRGADVSPAVASLAFTGFSLGRDLLVALALLAIGTVLAVLGRPRGEPAVRVGDRLG